MSILIWIIGVLLVLGFILYKLYTRNDYYWQKRGFTYIGPETIGPTWRVALNRMPLWEFDAKIYKRAKKLNQKIVGLLLFTQPELMIVDLDLARNIFIKDFDSFMDRRPLPLEKTDPMFHKMLFFMESEAWKELRNKMTPTFTTGKIKRMYHIFENSGNKLLQHLERDRKSSGNSSVDFIDGFERYEMDVIASAAFGLDAKLFEVDSMFQKMGKKLQIQITPKMMAIFIIMIVAPKLAELIGEGFVEQKTYDYFIHIITQAIRHREQSGEQRDDFLQIMLEARKELQSKDGSSVVLSDDTIIAQSVLFILAGFDTTNTLLLFSVYELALNPEIQEKLYNELKKLKHETNGEFNYEGLNGLEYLDKVLNETLRKYPPAPVLDRRTMRDYTIPDTELVIPKDTMVRVPSYAIHYDPEHFPNPQKFDPERFSPEVKSTRHPLAWMPFGHGPRNCIGTRFALINSKMSIANVVVNYKLEPCEKTTIPVEFANLSSLKPKHGMWLKISPRG